MTPDEIAAETEPAERQSAGAAVDNLLEEQLRATLKDLQRASLQPKPVEDLHGSEDVQSLLSRHLDQDSSERRAIYNRLQTIERAIKKATLARDCPLPNRDRYWCCSHAGLAVLRRDNQANNRDKGSGTWLVAGDKADDHQLDAAAWLDEATGQPRKHRLFRPCRRRRNRSQSLLRPPHVSPRPQRRSHGHQYPRTDRPISAGSSCRAS